MTQDTGSKPTLTPEVVARFQKYVDANPVWGCLHIVLSDLNLDDCHVEHAIQWGRVTGDTEGMELAELLLRMSKTQRRKLSKLG